MQRTADESVHEHMLYLMKGYHLRAYSTVAEPKIVCHSKGVVSADSTLFKKVAVSSLKFCTDRCDKSRRVNSYIEAAGTYGRIKGTVASCASCTRASNAREICFCKKDLFFEVADYHVCRSVLADACNNGIKCNVEVDESTGNVIKVPLKGIRKCLALNVCGKRYLCSLDESFIIEVT